MGPSSDMAKRTLAAMRAAGRRRDMATPSRLGVAGCHAAPQVGRATGSEPCPGQVVWTGLLLVRATREHPAQVWQAFACNDHGTELIARRPLRLRDQAVLDTWRAYAQRGDTGQSNASSVPGADEAPRPIAEGDVAHELIHRARQWTGTHYAE